jgi:hypothetical protein
MSGRYSIRLLTIIAALVALVLLAGVGTAVAAPPSEMTTEVIEMADCGNSKVAALGTAENHEGNPYCYPSFALPLLAFGDYVDPNPLTNCGRERWRGFLQFPVDDIPTHARIVDAELKVFVQYPFLPAPGSVTVGVHRVTEDWDMASLSWPGPAYTLPAKWQAIGGQAMYVEYTWDVKQIVKAWARGEPNYGLAFVAKGEGSNANVFAACPDCWPQKPAPLPAPPPDPLNKATLIVTYVAPPGLE